jgi:hypothetical protein
MEEPPRFCRCVFGGCTLRNGTRRFRRLRELELRICVISTVAVFAARRKLSECSRHRHARAEGQRMGSRMMELALVFRLVVCSRHKSGQACLAV